MNFKKIAIFLFFIVTGLFCTPAVSLAEYFNIEQYDVEVNVLQSNRYEVVETIEVEFIIPRHGIIRSIPLQYNHRPVLIENIFVEGYGFTSDRESGNENIKIGNAAYTVDGKQVYKIHYDFDVGEDGIEDYDEFYFNLIGSEWSANIKNANFTIHMPAEFDASRVNITRGSYGSTSTDGIEFEVNDSVITGRITQMLHRNEGVTIALPLPEGYYVGEREVDDIAGAMGKISWFLYPLLIGISLLIWYRFGRDKPLFPSVQFYPPAGLTPCDIGYIINGQVNGKDVTSLLFYWADKGNLEIHQEDKKWLLGSEVFRFVRKNSLNNAKPYEHTAFHDLFSYGNGRQVTTEDLKDNFYKTISKVTDMVTGQFIEEKAIWSKTSKKMANLTLLISVIPYIYLIQQWMVYNGSVDSGWIFWLVVGILALIADTGLMLVTSKWEGRTKSQKVWRIIFCVGIFVIMFGGPAVLIFSSGMSILEALKAAVTGTFMALTAGLVYQKTEYGHSMYEYLLGFREFLHTAEKERIEQLILQDPVYFYNILPYAVVLGVTEKWANKFESILTQPPNWYYGSAHYGAFSAANFGRQMDNCFTQTNRSMTSSPSSGGGSDGGGFSGGGAGGGGGSSW